MIPRGPLLSAAIILLLALALALPAAAQFNASIQGTVLDPQGAVIPNVTVKVTHQETGRTYESVASESGFYRIAGLPPGKYTVTIEAQGFKKSVTKDVVVSAEEVRGLDIRLEVGAVAETVTVTSEAPPLHTETASITKAITTAEIQRLPQVGRDPYELLRLAPGVFGDGARAGNGGALEFPNSAGPGGSDFSVFQVENQVPISANGQRISANNFTLDGVNVNSLTWGGAAVVTPNQESVQEVTVLSSSYSAEDGRNSGAQIKVVSKTGTNDFHGSGFIKFNDPGLNAFNKFGGSNAPPVRVNQKLRQFGSSLGGPLVKEKVFFFFSYEGVRSKNTEFFNKFVESPEFRQQVQNLRASTVTGTILRDPGIEPRIASVLPASCTNFTNQGRPCAVVGSGLDIGSITGAPGQYVSLGDPDGGGLDGIPDLQFVQLFVPNTQRGDQFNGRVDYTRGNNQFALSAYFTRRDDELSNLGAQGRPMADLTFQPLNSAVFLSWIRVISTTTVNEARFNFSRFAFNQVESSSGVNFGIPRVEVEGLPIGDRIRFGVDRSETTPGRFAQNSFAFRDVLSMRVGSHGLKYGFEVTREQDNNNLLGGARPLYSFVGLFNLANDTPIFEAINADPKTGLGTDLQRYFRTTNLGLFVQDDWKIRPNLTLNLGLRYEYFSPLGETQNRATNLELGPTADPLDRAHVIVRGRLFEPDRNNFAPILGFAWNPTAFENKMVLRGGFGVSFNRIPNVLFANTRGNVPFIARFNICCGTAATDFGTPFANGQIFYTLGTSNDVTSYPPNPALIQNLDPNTNLPVAGAVEIWGTPPEVPNGYVYKFSLEGEYSLPWKLVGSLGYQGSSSHKLIRIVNLNFMFDDLNPAMFAIFFPTPDINANFHALNTGLRRQFWRGFQFDFRYRWSKSIDTLSNEGPGAFTNQTFPRDLSTERGPSDFDATHFFTLTGLWDVPILRGRSDWVGKAFGGWQINGIFTFHSGFPWTAKTFRQCLQFPGGSVLCPTRPIGVLREPLDDHESDAFLRPGGNFPGGGLLYFDASAAGRPGVGRNSFRGPRFTGIDLSLAKETWLPNLPFFGEQAKLDFRANLFNAFNKLNLEPFGFFSAGTIVEDGRFGQAERGLAGRVIEFQLRFSF